MEDRRVVLWQERDADRSNEVEREKAQLVARQTKEAAQLVARHFGETVQLLERQAAKTARLKTATEAALAARAAGVSQWGSELPPLFLQKVLRKVLELLQWQPAACGAMRAVCSTWCSIVDALLPKLQPQRSLAVMKGKMGWYQSMVELDLAFCMNGCGSAGRAGEHAVAPQPLAAREVRGARGGR
jgi:hypothetical protein